VTFRLFGKEGKVCAVCVKPWSLDRRSCVEGVAESLKLNNFENGEKSFFFYTKKLFLKKLKKIKKNCFEKIISYPSGT